MITIRTCAALSLSFLLATSVAASSALAQANCDVYGKMALQQQQENAAKKCGFAGAEWSPDLKAHIAWCSGVGPDQWKTQLQARKQKLDGCVAK